MRILVLKTFTYRVNAFVVALQKKETDLLSYNKYRNYEDSGNLNIFMLIFLPEKIKNLL